MKQAVIVSAARTAVGKAPNGALRNTRPDDMAAAVIGAVLDRAPGFDRAAVEDVIFGCAMPEAEQGLNVARIAALRAGLPVSASAVTINLENRRRVVLRVIDRGPYGRNYRKGTIIDVK